jgi:predicted acylesterase/phospholipase RssA
VGDVMAHRKTIACAALCCTLLLEAACSRPSRLGAVPNAAVTRAFLPGMPEETRFWAMADPQAYVREVVASSERERRYRARKGYQGPLPRANYLAISGGGDDGAFAAGMLKGWTQAGTRPEFTVVTGISTGALIAPLAFLGPAYDDELKRVYTTVSTKDIVRRRHVWALLFSDGMVDPSPLAHLISRFIDAPTLGRIAEEYEKGRRLLVITADLDALQPVIWNMTAIAASRQPNALELFRTILIAAVSSPGIFPPVMIDVEANGQRYQEMHVDGGAISEVFFYPAMVHAMKETAAVGVDRERTLYVIRNARLHFPWASVERQTLPIARRALYSLVQTQGIGDLYRLYALARRDKVAFNLASIPPGFPPTHKEDFDPEYMSRLFELGRSLAASGYHWETTPPEYGDDN